MATDESADATDDVTIRRANVAARELLEAVEATTDPENHPVATTGDLARHVFETEDARPVRGGLVSDAMLDLARQGFVGHDRIGGHDVWVNPRVEQYDETVAPAGGEGDSYHE